MFMRYWGDAVGHVAHRDLVWSGNDDADVNGLGDEDEEEGDTATSALLDLTDDPDPLLPDVTENNGEEDEEPADDKSDEEEDYENFMRSDGEDDEDEDSEEEYFCF
jgi:hypothetical protein